MIDITDIMITPQNKKNYNKLLQNPPNIDNQNIDINNNNIIKNTLPLYDSNIGKSTDIHNSEKIKYE